MGNTALYTGMVLSAQPMGEYDKRLTILTKEAGKISAFAKGARRPNSPLTAAANPFAFGTFEIFEGRSSLTIQRGTISNYFRKLLESEEGVYYGFYFLEIADYYGKENGDHKELLKLLYQSLRALEKENLPNPLVRRIFELKAFALNGEYPNVTGCQTCKGTRELSFFSLQKRGCLCKNCYEKKQAALREEENLRDVRALWRDAKVHPPKDTIFPLLSDTRYAMEYIIYSPVEQLYRFLVSPQVLENLEEITEALREQFMDRRLHSLKVLEENLGFADFYREF